MTKDNVKKPFVLLLLQGWGLSTSWSKNIIASANPKSFDRLWREYEHVVIQPIHQSGKIDKKMAYRHFFQDLPFISDRELIDEFLGNINHASNKLLANIFGQTLKHSSKLHHIAILSENNQFGDVRHLVRLVQIAKTSGIFRQEIHLFIDQFQSTELLRTRLNGLASDLAKIDGINISTISFVSDLWNKDGLANTLDLLILGQGKRVMSIGQIELADNKSGNHRSYILTKDKNFYISDFDSVLFSDYGLEIFKPLIQFFTGIRRTHQNKKLKYLFVASLLSMVEESVKCNKSTKNFALWLTRFHDSGKVGSIIADDVSLNLISSGSTSPHALKPFSIDDSALTGLSTIKKIDKIARLVEKKLDQKNDDFILIDLPFVENACHLGHIPQLTDTITTVDGFLSRLESATIKNEGVLAVSSLYGMAENYEMVLTPSGMKPKFSDSAVPFITVSDHTKTSRSAKLSINDLMGNHHDFQHLKNSIFKNLELDNY